MTTPPFDGRQACLDKPLDWFFPEQGADAPHAVAVAKSLCADCPVRAECLDFALWAPATVSGGHIEGVWGQTTTAERKDMRRRHGRGAA